MRLLPKGNSSERSIYDTSKSTESIQNVGM